MLVLFLALLAPNAFADGLEGDAGVCLLRPHHVSGQQADWVVWLEDSQIGMLRDQTYYCFKAEPGVVVVELTETSATHMEFGNQIAMSDGLGGITTVSTGDTTSYSKWRTRVGTLEIEAMADETVFYTVKRKKKSFRFEEADRDTFERLDLQSSR